MRPLLELHARSLRLRHLAKCLHPLPNRTQRNAYRSTAARIRGVRQVSKFVPRRLPWLLLISALIFLADRLSKLWIEAHVRRGGAILIIPRILRITHWTNEGAAFSLFAQSASPQVVRWALVAF